MRGEPQPVPSTGKFTSTVVTTSSLTGSFTSPKKASGTIIYKQTDVYDGNKPTTCGPVTVTFTANA
jgi:hypothetical protein